MIWGILEQFWQPIAGILAAIVGGLGVYLKGRSDGAMKAAQRDTETARKIEERADEALRRLDGDTRPVDERLRSKGRLRD